MFPFYSFWKELLSWWEVKFYQMIFCIYWDGPVFFVFIWCGVSHWFISICWIILVTLGWIQLCHHICSFSCVVGFGLKIFVENICTCINQRCWLICNFQFFCGMFVWFWYQSDGGFIECLWSAHSSSIFWKSLRRISIASSLCLVEFTYEAKSPGL